MKAKIITKLMNLNPNLNEKALNRDCIANLTVFLTLLEG
jgi:hypothetical protein